MEFAGQPFRVLLLESGGFERDEETQALYKGKNIGLPYFPLDISRLRYFGGTTNHWGGMCVPFDEIDFEKRDWIPYSGWPFSKSAIDSYYKRAYRIVPLRKAEWASESWIEPNKPLLRFVSNRVITIVCQKADYQLSRFGRAYRDKVVQAGNITTCIHANVTQIETSDTGKRVTRLRAACLSGSKFSVAGKLIILAAGGIENARLLLLSNERRSAGVGNEHDLVGRFFLEHPLIDQAAIYRPSDPRLPMRFYQYRKVKDSTIKAELGLSQEVRRKEKLLSVKVGVHTLYDELYTRALDSKGLASFRYLYNRFRKGDVPNEFGKHLSNVMSDIEEITTVAYEKVRFGGDYPIDHIKLPATIDPAPNPDSRVTLGTDLDKLGQRRVQLDWRLSPLDKHSIRKTLEIIGREIGRAGLGRLQIRIDDDETTWPADIKGAYHHMGTTRMSDDPKQGVVDKDCRLHGISNLFIAGSSVFPTAGIGTPTLMVIALALRLADHIKKDMQ
jgi:choline dehydrogenase-like flavoprotein